MASAGPTFWISTFCWFGSSNCLFQQCPAQVDPHAVGSNSYFALTGDTVGGRKLIHLTVLFNHLHHPPSLLLPSQPADLCPQRVCPRCSLWRWGVRSSPHLGCPSRGITRCREPPQVLAASLYVVATVKTSSCLINIEQEFQSNNMEE